MKTDFSLMKPTFFARNTLNLMYGKFVLYQFHSFFELVLLDVP